MRFHLPVTVTVTVACVCVCVCVTGCYSFKPVDVRVRDAESGEPIDRATVCIVHTEKMDFRRPPGEKCVTAAHGAATVGADVRHAPMIKVTSPGYLPGHVPVHLPSPEPRRLLETIELYRQPAPQVRLTLPEGYRGLVKIVLRWPPFREGKPVRSETYPAGQRIFAMSLPSPATVNTLDYSPLIPIALARRLSATYEDGIPIETARRGYPEAVAIRPLGSPRGRAGWGTIYLFFVGTLAEWEPVAREVDRQGTEIDARWMEQFCIPGTTSQPTAQ